MIILYFDGFRNVAYHIFERSFEHRDANLEGSGLQVLYKIYVEEIVCMFGD